MPTRPGTLRPMTSTLQGLLLAIAVALVASACSAGAAPPSATPTSPTPSSPASSPSGAPSGSVASAEEAAAAVARFDSNFLGYGPRDPDLIGQSAWFEAKAVAGGYELTFFRGSGDCPAGCIERSFIKFFVARDGRVEKRCEWQEGGEASSTPC
jgi:hypothetical protein